MALSEEERRRLAILEQELASSDPELDRRLQDGPPGKPRREPAALIGLITMAAGFALVFVGIATELIIVGTVGFLMMVAGAHWFLKGFRLRNGPEEERTGPSGTGGRSSAVLA